MWRAERRRCALSVEDRLLNLISISDATEISVIELTRRTDCLEHFGAQYQSLGGVDGDSTFWGFFPDALGPGEDIRLEQLFFSSCEWADRFVDDVVQYAEALDSGVVGVTLDSAEAQLRGLRAVLIAADQEQSLHLVPKLFQADNTGARAKRVLEAFSDQLGRYHALAPIVNQGFRSESSANQERLNVLRQLDGVAARLGASHQSIADLIELCRVLRRESERLADAFRIVGDFCAQKRIPFDGDRSKLPRLARLAQAVTEVPDELLHLQTSGLTPGGVRPSPGSAGKCAEAVDEAVRRLEQQSLRRCFAYRGRSEAGHSRVAAGRGMVPNFPEPVAVGGFSPQDASAEKRAAAGCSPDRTARTGDRIPSPCRAPEERPGMELYLGFPAPADELPLDGHLTLAIWNRSIDSAAGGASDAGMVAARPRTGGGPQGAAGMR